MRDFILAERPQGLAAGAPIAPEGLGRKLETARCRAAPRRVSVRAPVLLPFAAAVANDYVSLHPHKEIAQRWVVEHRDHAGPGARSAFSAWQDSLWGPWRVWCHCGASLEASHASCELIALVARPSVVRMNVDKWKGKTGDQTAIVW